MSSPKNACVGGYICLAARWFRLLWTISFEFAKVCWIRFSSWESFISFHIWACSNFMEKVVLERERFRLRLHLVPFIVWRVNVSKLSWNFVWGLRTATTTNCRVGFTDFYSVFLTNFKIVFWSHTNTIIVLEPYEPGLLVSWPYNSLHKMLVKFNHKTLR